MKIHQVITQRTRSKGKDYGIVNEWEDVFAAKLNAVLYYDDWKRRDKLIFWKMPWLAKFFQTWTDSFTYVMLPLHSPHGNNKRNIVPCIVDFFIRSNGELAQFYKRYCNNPLVLISSKEAYDYLKSVNCPLSIAHLALSLPDEYAITAETRYEKQYDVVMLGRQNSVLMEFLERYKSVNPQLTYVYGKKDGMNFQYFDQDGRELGALATRQEYIEMLRKSRVALYATPGMDNSRSNTNGFNQVTPRFLECIASGCHVIARYPQNSDTIYYDLDKMAMKVTSYKEFEVAMNKALSSEVNMKMYSEYLKRHYTSVRADELQGLLNKI